MRRFAVLFAAILAASCTPELPEGVFACTDDSACPHGWACDLNVSRCVSELPPDGGTTCLAGFAPSESGGCVDIDECATADACGPGAASCTNTAPGFACTCTSGFAIPPNAQICADVDECALGHDDCSWTASCANTSGSFGCTCPTGYAATQGHTCVSTCVPGSDSDSGTLNWTVEEFLVNTVGIDIDGLNNAPVAMGGAAKTIAGCSVTDAVGGGDVALSTLSGTLQQAGVDLQTAFHGAVATSGALAISLAITKLPPPLTADDPCIAVTLTMDGQSTMGVGAMVGHVLTIDFASPITFSVPITVPQSSCNGGSCNAGAELSFRLLAPRARLELNASHSNLVHGTLAGFLFFDDADPAYDAFDSTSQTKLLQDWATAVNLDTNLTSSMLSVFGAAKDLHMNPDGSLSPCTGPSASTVNTNAISAAFYLASP